MKDKLMPANSPSEPYAAEDAAVAMLESAARKERQRKIESERRDVLPWLRRLIRSKK